MVTQLGKTLSVWLLLSACCVMQVHAAGYSVPVQVEGQGVIHALDFEKYTILVSGRTYHVSQTVHVEIAGSYGAFTLLKQGMKVRFNYLEYSDGRNEIVQLYEDNFIEDS